MRGIRGKFLKSRIALLERVWREKIAPTGAQVVELGPINATIHKVDECVKADDLDTLSEIYEQILVELLG